MIAPHTPWTTPEPLPDDLPPVQAFDPKLLPLPFRAWAIDTADRMNCPMDFLAVSSMVSAASVVGAKICIRPKAKDNWSEVLNLWGCIVARPSRMKSPARSAAMAPLCRLEADARDAHAAAVAEAEDDEQVRDARLKATKTALKTAAKEEDENAIEDAKAKLADLRAVDGPTRRRFVTSDATTEKLGEILKENPQGLLVDRDELTGWLRTMDRSGHEGDRAFYLSCWNGTGAYTVDRIGRGTIDIPRTCLSVFGGIQPGPLADYYRDAAKGGAGDDGLVQRFQLAVYPDDPSRVRVVDRFPDGEAKRAYSATFDRLAALDAVAYGARVDPDAGEDAIPHLRFDQSAQPVFWEWLEDLEQRLRDEESPVIEATLGKHRGLIPKLAALIHVIEAGPGSVGGVPLDALNRAIRWGEYLESHARRIASGQASATTKAARSLLKKLESKAIESPITVRGVYRRHWSGLATKEDADAAIELLEERGHLRVEEVRDASRGGRPTTNYVWHGARTDDGECTPEEALEALQDCSWGDDDAKKKPETPVAGGAKSDETTESIGFGTFGTTPSKGFKKKNRPNSEPVFADAGDDEAEVVAGLAELDGVDFDSLPVAPASDRGASL